MDDDYIAERFWRAYDRMKPRYRIEPQRLVKRRAQHHLHGMINYLIKLMAALQTAPIVESYFDTRFGPMSGWLPLLLGSSLYKQQSDRRGGLFNTIGYV